MTTPRQVRAYLEALVERKVPSVNDLVDGIDLTVVYKAGTYETLKDVGFIQLVSRALPEIEVVYREYEALRVEGAETGSAPE